VLALARGGNYRARQYPPAAARPEDSTIADLAVATGAGQIRSARVVRLAKDWRSTTSCCASKSTWAGPRRRLPRGWPLSWLN